MSAVPVRAVIVTAFEPDAGPVPGEFRYWRERLRLNRELAFPPGYRPLRLNDERVLGIITGVGAARAAASVMALGLDPRFDLTAAYWLISGVAGINPERGSLASVVLPEYVVDGALAHEIDAREIPPEWADGFVPIGKSVPYEEPREDRFNDDDGIVYRLNAELVKQAYGAALDIELMDTANMAARRVQFAPEAAHQAPSVLTGDELSSTTFWHGRLMSERAKRWVAYQTEGRGRYAITAMEDAGILQSLKFLAGAGRVDFARIVIARGASNYDQQREAVTAAESLVESRVAANSGYLPALENAYRVGSRILTAICDQSPA